MEENTIDMSEIVAYVQDKLFNIGFILDEEVLRYVLDFELDFLVEKGFAYIEDEGEYK